MKTALPVRNWIFLASLVLLICSLTRLSAEQSGLFTYQVIGGATVEITDYPTSETGAVEIPAQIEGKPVTSIGDHAFGGSGLSSIAIPEGVTSIGNHAFFWCRDLTGINIPASVTNIGNWAFSNSSGLTSITISENVTSIGAGAFSNHTGLTSVTISASVTIIGDDTFSDCSSLTSITIPENVTSIGAGAFSGCSGLIGISIPEGVTSIGDHAFAWSGLTSITLPAGLTSITAGAFWGCIGLTGIAIPAGVTSIDSAAFRDCRELTNIIIPSSVTSIGDRAFWSGNGTIQLTSVIFLGDAPALGDNAFSQVNPEFTIQYLSSKQGFSSPTWQGYPAVEIDESAYPAASWLLTYGYPYDTALDQDLNGDGVSLLMAYALDLDPNRNLAGRMPVAVLEPGTMSITFHGTSPGITCLVETSTDLQAWTTDGVTLSEPNAEGHRTATVERDVPRRFLRLMVGED